jgi:HTH-type transcriptional regulator, sugar sensing transcriptional regulator
MLIKCYSMTSKLNGFKDESIQTLIDLGLSSYQSKVYLTLLRFGNQTAYAISETVSIARCDAYRVLQQLEKAGLIEKIIKKPEEFCAISIDACISTLMQQRIDKTAELARRVRLLSNDVKSECKDLIPFDQFQFILLPKKIPVYLKAERMLLAVQNCVCFLGLARRMTAWLSNCMPSIEAMLARKVNCKMIMTEPDLKPFLRKQFGSLCKYSNFELRILEKSRSAGFSVWDRKEILITTSPIDSASPAPTLWSNNTGLVVLAQDYFDILWTNAKEAAL